MYTIFHQRCTLYCRAFGQTYDYLNAMKVPLKDIDMIYHCQITTKIFIWSICVKSFGKLHNSDVSMHIANYYFSDLHFPTLIFGNMTTLGILYFIRIHEHFHGFSLKIQQKRILWSAKCFLLNYNSILPFSAALYPVSHILNSLQRYRSLTSDMLGPWDISVRQEAMSLN